jgi:signal transduction histidine kinase
MAERNNNMIMTDIERLKRLVDQILVASRIDRGAFLFSDETVPSNFDGMLKQIIRKLEHLDPEIGGRLVIKIPEGLLIKTASASLDLIISNLLENAIKYSPRKSPITVTVHEAKGKMILAIEDQGHGMDKRDLRRVFKMFYRSETATRKAIPGTGLGLYIVKSVAKVMGGRVWAESRGLSYGSTFFLSLPDGYFTINADQDFE